MAPHGPPAPVGGSQPVPSSLLRSTSGLLGGQGVGLPSQNSFSSLVSPCNQFNNVSMLSNNPSVASLLHQSFGNGGSGAGTSGRGFVDGGVELDPLSGIEAGVGLNHPSLSFISSSGTAIPNSSGQVRGQQQVSHASGNQMLTNQLRGQQIDPQDSERNQQQLQQYSVSSNPQQQSLLKQQQQKFHAMRNGFGVAGPVKLEPLVTNEQAPQLQNLRSLGRVNLDPQQLQQQRFMQFQHQQQLLKSMPQQRPPLQPQFQQQNLPLRSPMKPVYEPGMCARRLQHYMYQQQHRPEDNNIEFWRKFVAECFAPNAKKKWCVSMYGSGRQTTGGFPQDVWHCEICNRRPGRGFEATVEVLPRLFRIKYESGTLEELLYVDMPREYQNSSGQIVLDYAKAVQQSVFEQLRVVREGQLRIVFSPDLKICSWEFCARRHEEFIPRKLLIPQVSQLGAAVQKFQTATQNASSSNTVSELQNNCTMFVASARQLAKALEVPLVNDLGYTKRYVRCLQISEVVNSMKDLIDYSRETGMGPMESLTKFPRRSTSSSSAQGQSQQPESQVQHQQQTLSQNSKNDPNSHRIVNNSMNMPTTSGAVTPVRLLHQNSLNSRQQHLTGANSPYGGNNVQMLSPGSSNALMNINGMLPASSNTSTILAGNEMANGNANVGSAHFGGIPNGLSHPVMVNGSDSSINGRGGMAMSRVQGMNQRHLPDSANHLRSGLGAGNGFDNLPFDWKASP